MRWIAVVLLAVVSCGGEPCEDVRDLCRECELESARAYCFTGADVGNQEACQEVLDLMTFEPDNPFGICYMEDES